MNLKDQVPAARSKLRAAQGANFSDQLAKMSFAFLTCRTVGHDLKPGTLEVERGVFELGLFCHNGCGLEVSLQRTRDGQVERRSWYANHGYLFRGTGRLTSGQRDEIWMAFLQEIEANPSLLRDIPKANG